MKLISLKLLFLFLTLSCFAQSKFSLTVNLPDQFNANGVELLFKDQKMRDIEESFNGILKGNAFTFQSNLTTPSRFAFLEVDRGGTKYSVRFMLDTGANQVSLAVKDEQYKILQLVGKLSISNRIKEQLDSIELATYTNYKKKNNIKGAFSLSKQFSHQLDLDKISILKKYPNHYAALLQLNSLSRSITMLNYSGLIVDALQLFEKKLQNSELALSMLDRYDRIAQAEKASQVGQKMFAFDIINQQDSTIVSSKRFQNKPYIMAFSATWCVPCREHLPMLKSLYHKYKDKGLEVIYVNQDDNHEEWSKFVKAQNVTWTSVSGKKDKNSVSANLNVEYIPNYFIVDKTGTIIYNSDQMDPYLNKLEDYIKRSL